MKELKIEKMASWSQVPMTATVPTCIYGNRRPCTLEPLSLKWWRILEEEPRLSGFQELKSKMSPKSLWDWNQVSQFPRGSVNQGQTPIKTTYETDDDKWGRGSEWLPSGTRLGLLALPPRVHLLALDPFTDPTPTRGLGRPDSNLRLSRERGPGLVTSEPLQSERQCNHLTSLSTWSGSRSQHVMFKE